MGKTVKVSRDTINRVLKVTQRAENAIKRAQQIEASLKTAGLFADSYNTYAPTESLINEVRSHIKSGKRITRQFVYKVKVLGERTDKFWASGIKMTTGNKIKRGKNLVAGKGVISVRQAQNLSARYAKTKQASADEYRVIRRYNAAINPISNASALAYTPQELVAMRNRKKGLKNRDVSFGGDSTLINDLAYSAQIDYAREFIEMLMDIMQDPFMFEQIESWYRSNTDLQKLLDGATGSYWYEDYCEARNIIIALINELKKNYGSQLKEETNKSLDDIRGLLDNEADTYNEY